MNTRGLVARMNRGDYRKGVGATRKVTESVAGFSGVHVMRILNMAVSEMGDDEYYLEIGSHKGRTLIGALIDNDKRAVSVDNFSEFGSGAREKLHQNVLDWDMYDRVKFYHMDSTRFFEEKMPLEGKVGVYLYDGNHNTDQGLAGLRLVVPYLADEAIIILDDFSSHGVWRSVLPFLQEYELETALVFCMRTNDFPVYDVDWWNGIVVIHWKIDRNLATGV